MPTLTPAYGTPEYTAQVNAALSGTKNVNGTTNTGATFSGGTYTPVVAPAPVSTLSSKNGANALDQTIADHKTEIANIGKTTPVGTPTTGAGNAITAEEASASGADLTKYSYDQGTKLYTPAPVDQSSDDPQYAADQKTINDAFAQQVAGMDAATQNLIASIQGIYTSRIADQQEANRRELATFNTMNTRYGTSRYAPGVATGILTADERAGLDRIGKIATEEAGLIAQANQSLTDKKYAAFVEQRNQLTNLRKERIAVLEKIKDRAYEEDKATKERALKLEDQFATDRKTILEKVIKGGAPSTIIDAIRNSKTTDEALAQAGNYLNSPADILDAQYKKAQIDKIYSEINQTTGGDNSQLFAYANQYASTGKIPIGIPKGTFGQIAQIAKELPKTAGQLVDTRTGVAPDAADTTINAFAATYSAVELARQLKDLDSKRWDGIIAGTAGKVFGSEDQQRYVDLRSQIVDLLARARSGAALTVSEERRYSDMLPGRFSESFGLGPDSQVRIDNFISNLSSDIKNKASAQGWAINGLSEIKLGDSMYKVGDVIKKTLEDGTEQKGRVNADGTITLINQ